MKNCERLYNLYKNEPTLTNPEAGERLKWTARQVIKYKYLLKKRGFIGVDDNEIVILKEYSGTDLESGNLKQEMYQNMLEACLERAEREDTTTPQFISLIQEMRLILNKIV